MNTEMSIFVIVAALLFVVFLVPKLWASRNPEPGAARRRALGVFVLLLAVVLVAAIAVRFAAPDSAPNVLLIAIVGLELVGAVLYRHRLLRYTL